MLISSKDKLYPEITATIKEISQKLDMPISHLEDCNSSNPRYERWGKSMAHEWYNNNTIGVWLNNNGREFITFSWKKDELGHFIPSQFLCKHGVNKFVDSLKEYDLNFIGDISKSYLIGHCSCEIPLPDHYKK